MKWDTSQLEQGIDKLARQTDLSIQAFAETGALKMQSYAQQNAPWTNRSGRARQTLKGSVEKQPEKTVIILSHGVDYGLWLELAHEKRFAIIPDTLRYVGQQEIMPAFKNLLKGL